VPHCGTLAETFDGMAELLAIADAALDSPVGIDLDTNHVHNCGATLERFVSTYGARLAHVAVRHSTGTGEWGMPVGARDIDFSEVTRLLTVAGSPATRCSSSNRRPTRPSSSAARVSTRRAT